MSDNSTIRAAGYCRVSMREQVEGHSLDAQELHIHQFAEAHGWVWVQTYTDAGLSAKKDSHRPALAQLLADAAAGQFDVVIVDKVDRFYRHLSGLMTALDTLHQQGVALASVQENLDLTTPWGKLMLTVLGMLAEIYIDNLRQETRKGKHQRARKGLWNGNIPFGYCNGRCSACVDLNGPGYCPQVGQANQTDGKHLIIHPVDGEVVRLAFAHYLEHQCSNGCVADYLNQLERLGPDGQRGSYRQRGVPGRVPPGIFNKDMLRGLLQSEFYLGRIRYHNRSQRRKGEPAEWYPGQHPALVDEDTFRRAQELRRVLGRHVRAKLGRPAELYPLSGLVRCGYCGLPLRAGTTKGKRTYRDTMRIEHRGECPQPPSVSANALEAQVIDRLTRLTRRGGDMVPAQRNIVERIEARWRRAGELYLAGEIERGAYESEKTRYESEMRGLQKVILSNIVELLPEIRAGLAGWTELSQVKKKKAASPVARSSLCARQCCGGFAADACARAPVGGVRL